MTLATSDGTRALIDLEDAMPDALLERLPGAPHPFWPQVRSLFMVALQDADYGSSAIETPTPKRSRVWGDLVRAMLPSGSDIRGLRSRRRIVHLAGGRTVYRVDGCERNWLFGDLLDAAPSVSALLQWAPMPDVRPAFPVTRSLAPAVTRAAAYARMSRPLRAGALNAVGTLVREYARLLGGRVEAGRIDQIAASALYQEASRPHVESQVLRVLDRLRPEVLLMEDASYGTWSSLIARIKRRGVLVAEPQHGWIGPSHGAYNFGAAMWKPELVSGLPDELLTFGPYWGADIRTPSSVIPIGKPHLEAATRSAKPWAERPAQVLVVSSVVDPEGTSEFTEALAESLPEGWRVRFRAHPSERAALSTRYPRLVAHQLVDIDGNADVYESLRAARVVIGVASTVLFEALAMGCQVFARESPTSDYYVGDLFGTRLEGIAGIPALVKTIREPGGGAQLLADDLWEPGAAENFTEWLQQRIPT